MPEPLIRARGLTRRYGSGDRAVTALDGVDLDVPAGVLLAVRGRSGSGKTTLLNLLGGLDRPDAGTVELLGAGDPVEVSSLGEAGLVRLRRERVGMVFQTFGLVPILDAAENVGVPLRLLGVPAAEREQRVAELLGLVGLSGQARQRPHELSGGQQQRVAIARALANRPQLVIADEPTGQLDSQTGRAVMELLLGLTRERDVTVVVATHDPVLTSVADTVVDLHSGRLGAAPSPG